MSQSMIFVVMVIPVLFLLCPYKSHAGSWVCRPCQNQEECDEDPKQFCVYGEARDSCGRRICAKGPGERCGGTLNIFGKCNSNLMCIEEVCHGCSMSIMQEDPFECYPRQQT